MHHFSARKLLRISLGFVLLLLLVIAGSCNLGGSVTGLAPFKGRRSLLSLPSDGHDTHLFAKLDGTINLLDLESKTLLWSFPSGPPIYSSYQAPVNHGSDTENASETTGRYFVDCGDDWKLVAHTKLGRMKLDLSAEEFVRITPHIAEDGGVVVGSKKTTVFLVDANTGRIIYIYRSPHPSPTSLSNEGSKSIKEWESSSFVNIKPGDRPLHITRTDYSLSSFAPYSGEVMWNVTVADIGAVYLCKDNENSTGNELPSGPGVHFNMPLTCESKVYVHRLRNSRILDALPAPGMLSEDRNEDLMLPTPAPDDLLHKPAKFDEFLEFYNKNDVETALSLPQNSRIYGSQDVEKPSSNGSSLFSGGPRVPLVPFLLIIIGFLAYGYSALVGKSNNEVGEPNAKVASSKRKKPRKSGKNSSLQKVDENECPPMEDEIKPLLNLNGSIDGDEDGRAIGRLFVSSKEIAKGSNGTIVFEGLYEGRKVAVKRLVKEHHDVAYKEIQNLIASDQHPNIVRWYGVEYNQDFVYLALERCACSLNDLIQMHSDSFEKPTPAEGQMTKALAEYKVRLESIKVVMHGINLWRPNGYPSPVLLKLMRDVVHGLVHLHELGIIHRDLKPQNVLIITEKPLCAKLSDMGISKRLVGDMSSLGHHATGYGSPGWQAPEQLLHGRQTRAVDMFSLGCVLFFCITGGKHPFGSHLERDANVAKNHVDLFLVEYIPEALDLLSRLLDPHAERRPKASKVLHHPLFWSSETRLSFLRDASDRVELEDREADSDVLKTLESKAPVALGGKWDEKMEPAFITNIGKYRRYKYDSVRDLLRVIRNKLNHYRELPTEIQELLGSVPEGFDDYFGSRFPKLLIEVYNVMHMHCAEEEWFQKYLNS